MDAKWAIEADSCIKDKKIISVESVLEKINIASWAIQGIAASGGIPIARTWDQIVIMLLDAHTELEIIAGLRKMPKGGAR